MMKFPYVLKHFKEAEFSCKCGCGLNNIDFEFVQDLHKARVIANTPFVIKSACRCSSHNLKVGGVFDSSHLKGLAVDIATPDSRTKYLILNSLLFVGFNRIGVYDDFMHVDSDFSKDKKVIW